MSYKNDLLRDIDDDFPQNLKNKMSVVIPTIQSVAWPSNLEDAIIAQGQVAVNVNTIMQAFAGIPVIELLLYIGQKNRVSSAMLLAMLELVQQTNKPI